MSSEYSSDDTNQSSNEMARFISRIRWGKTLSVVFLVSVSLLFCVLGLHSMKPDGPTAETLAFALTGLVTSFMAEAVGGRGVRLVEPEHKRSTEGSGRE